MLKAPAVALVVSLLVVPSAVLPQSSGRTVREVYRIPLGARQGVEVWVVDGATIRREIYPEFLYGGSSE